MAKVFELQLQYQSVFSISPMNIQDLLPLGFTGALHTLQGSLKSLLQHHNLKASVLQRSAFFSPAFISIQATRKTIGLTIQTFVGKMMSLLFNTLFRSVRLSGGSMIKNPPAYAGDARDSGSITGSGRSPGGGNGSLFQYSCLKNPMDRRSLEGYSPWGRRNLDMTEWLSTY